MTSTGIRHRGLMPTNILRLLPFLLLATGCPGTALSIRPDGSPGPQECPREALKAMQYLQLHPGDSALIEIDANQTGQSPISLNDGPIESFLWNEQLGWLPPTTRFYGQVFTGGPSVVIRYHSAQPPDTEPIPICAVARSGKGQMRKLPGSKPGNALLEFSKAYIYIVNDFR